MRATHPHLRRCLLALLVAQGLGGARAATFIVDDNSLGGSGCSLDEAITAINTTTDPYMGCAESTGTGFGSNDTVLFNLAPANRTITLAGSEITLDVSVAINSPLGDHITIDGNDASRIFSMSPGQAFELTNLTLTNGTASGGGDGGAIHLDTSRLYLTNVTISESEADDEGGALYASVGTIGMYNCVVSGNTASYGGGLRLKGGNLKLYDSDVSDNEVDRFGGGIRLGNNSQVTINNTRISGNKAYSSTTMVALGGGIYTNQAGLTIENSTISANFADSIGGLSLFGSGETTTILNSTVSGNTSTVSRAGGIYFLNHRLYLHNATITQNSGASATSSGIAVGASGTANLTNTVVADNPGAADCAVVSDFAVVVDGGGNLIEDNSHPTVFCEPFPATAPDPMLGPLADNGGPTLTHALQAGSPAIDAGSDAACPGTDQRGAARKDCACDAGAFEAESGDQCLPCFPVAGQNNTTALICL